MKKTILIILALSSVIFANAQSVEGAKKHLYYERAESAKNELKAVIGKGDNNPDALYWLAEIYLQQAQRDSAKEVLLRASELLKTPYSKKESPLVYLGWAHLLLDSGKTAEARSLMEQVLSEGKYKNATALLAAARANMHSKNGDSLWAIDLLQQAVKRDKKNPEIYTTLGDAYRKLVDGSKAVMNYDLALNQDPGYVEAIYKKGKIYKTQNNPEVYLQHFQQAYALDSTYTPALYELYYHYYFRDVVTARKYLEAYTRHADPNPEHDYMRTDLMYVSKQYDEAVKAAKILLAKEGAEAQPRLFKLIAYSQAALGDSTSALENMNAYFQKQDSSDFVVKDYALQASLLETVNPDKTAAIELYRKAIFLEKDKQAKLEYMVSLADLHKEIGNREREAVWRGRIYETKENPTNLDIYKWGLAAYYEKDYAKADSVFAIYAEKYPDHLHGYLWRARSSALLDSTMSLGLAVPHYKKLIEVAAADSVKNKAVLLTSYEYLGGYEANITKNYQASLDYFMKLAALDPENVDANKNVSLLKKWIDDGKGSN
jgi:tetratricopeptide (TPR) repeat protein